ncbi:MAG: KTSC domain-containing protein [Mesorhizobium sp.]|uniref:KTSC domain-containing protein n=1 Tax=Mesorhizobium sp. TaxID=1871066 RepID=UPI0011F74388|nr:KTSC domain-containing protein [Mesorhizobium sp.]TIP06580.1 MAG: KTSC domain-containing protein [Mesorhizobium sp.]TIP34107.1 MAG: KTSC domain-containing protein [Mesorhizobium sp.]TJV73494.1 MAG: KTSC domain-containing protein [Mesorhizobium sp.]
MPSTAIQNIHCDPSRRVLSAWFPSGDHYDYEDVEPEIYMAFKAALSKGQFFNGFVRDRFRYRLVGRGRRH